MASPQQEVSANMAKYNANRITRRLPQAAKGVQPVVKSPHPVRLIAPSANDTIHKKPQGDMEASARNQVAQHKATTAKFFHHSRKTLLCVSGIPPNDVAVVSIPSPCVDWTQ